MQKNIKYKLLIILCAALLFSAACFSMALTTTNYKTAAASEIDCINQIYQDFEGSVDEDSIYKIDCTDIRSVYGIDEIKDYVARIQFKNSAGCAIYFVNGRACNFTDVNEEDFETTKYSECYEILHYDAKNNDVYIQFKNFDKIEAGEIGDAEINEITISLESSLYLNRPQRVKLADIIDCSGIDYINQDYVDFDHNDYVAYDDFLAEDIVYKIHCPDIRKNIVDDYDGYPVRVG